MNRHAVALAFAGLSLLVASPSQAGISINVTRIAPGKTLPGVGTSRLSELCAAFTQEADGNSNFITDAQAHAVVKAAAKVWQNIYDSTANNHTLAVDWAFVYPEDTNLDWNVGGQMFPRTWSNGRLTRVSIAFDAGDFDGEYDGECNPLEGADTIQWFVDKTPNDTVEYEFGGLVIAEAQPRGKTGRMIETARNTVHTPTGTARLLDMYSVALHEIGHALGFNRHPSGTSKFDIEVRDDREIDAFHYSAKWDSIWPVGTSHYSEDNMQLSLMGSLGSLGWGRRLFPTQADILCIGSLNAWSIQSWGPNFFDYWNE